MGEQEPSREPTVTVSVSVPVPAGLLQSSLKVLLPVRLVMVSLPLKALLPNQSPEAVQLVGSLVVLQVRVVWPP